ncbi:MAG: DALR domain-containing protein, partial [Flavobacteriales bacterium]
PHHECEIAQNVGSNGDAKPVSYWMHSNMLTVNGRKMSKSEGNGFTPEELITGNHKLLDKGYSPMTVRFFMLMGHYASTLDFSNAALQAAEKGWQKMSNAWILIPDLKAGSGDQSETIESIRTRCMQAMNDDFNTPILIASMFEAVKLINSVKDGKIEISEKDKPALLNLFNEFMGEVLGLQSEGKSEASNDLTNELMELVLLLRKEAKSNKDFSTADLIRDKLTSSKVEIKDTREGTTWSYEG